MLLAYFLLFKAFSNFDRNKKSLFIIRQSIFLKGKTGTLINKKNSSLKSVLLKKSLHFEFFSHFIISIFVTFYKKKYSLKKSLYFESVSYFLIFVPKRSVLQKKTKKDLRFKFVSDFIIFVSEKNLVSLKKLKKRVCTWDHLSSIFGRISVEMNGKKP